MMTLTLVAGRRFIGLPVHGIATRLPRLVMWKGQLPGWISVYLPGGHGATLRLRALVLAVAFAFGGVPATGLGGSIRPVETEQETAPTSVESPAAPCWVVGPSGLRRHPAPIPRILSPLPCAKARARPPGASTAPALSEDSGLNGIGVPKLE